MQRRTALHVLMAAALGAVILAVPRAVAAESEIYVNSATGQAINGYDPVAYFTQDMPVAGDPAYTYDWKGAPFFFASAENRDMFAADPEKYAPQYGGWCAYAMAENQFATTVPEAFTVYNDKLYLNFSTGVRTLWRKDKDGYIARADGHWTAYFP